MAKKSNKKPGQSTATKKDTALTMKRRSTNLNQKKLTKVVLILMALAFVGPIVAGLIVWFFQK